MSNLRSNPFYVELESIKLILRDHFGLDGAKGYWEQQTDGKALEDILESVTLDPRIPESSPAEAVYFVDAGDLKKPEFYMGMIRGLHYGSNGATVPTPFWERIAYAAVRLEESIAYQKERELANIRAEHGIIG
jgi:hypothetical protein